MQGLLAQRGSPALVRVEGRAVEWGRAWRGLGSLRLTLRSEVLSGPGRVPPSSVPGRGTLQDACPRLSARARTQPCSLHRGHGSLPTGHRGLAPRPAAQPVSRVVGKAEVLAKPLGAETPSLAMGQWGLPASSHLFRPPVRPSVCPEVSDWHPGHPGLQAPPRPTDLGHRGRGQGPGQGSHPCSSLSSLWDLRCPGTSGC